MQKAVGTVSLIERFLTRNKGFVTIYAGKNDVCLEIMQENVNLQQISFLGQ